MLPWTPLPFLLAVGVFVDQEWIASAIASAVCAAWCYWVIWASGQSRLDD